MPIALSPTFSRILFAWLLFGGLAIHQGVLAVLG